MTSIEGGCTRARRRRRSHALPRRKTVRWSAAEVDGLLDGVREHGVGKWAAILRSSACFNAVRTSVDLKDKWRNLAAHVRALALQSNVTTPGTRINLPPTSTTNTSVVTSNSSAIPSNSLSKDEPITITAQSRSRIPYSAAPPPPPAPLHPTSSTLPPLAPSTAYAPPTRYAPRVLAPLPVPSLGHSPEDAAAAAAAAHAHVQAQAQAHHAHHHATHHAAAAAASVHPQQPHPHLPHHHQVSAADLSYFGDFSTRPSSDTLAQLRSLPPPSHHHTPHDAVPQAATSTQPPPALNFDPFPEPEL